MRIARVLAVGALFATLIVLSSDSLLSQEKKEGKLKGQLPQGWTKLDLTAAQKEDIYKLNAEYKAKVDKLEEEIKQLRNELTRKRIAVLTDEQRKKLTEMVTGGESGKEKAKDSAKGKTPDK